LVPSRDVRSKIAGSVPAKHSATAAIVSGRAKETARNGLRE
jgi:hypothetical protein